MAKTKYTKELLAPLVAESITLSEVVRKVGLRPSGGNICNIKTRIEQHGLDMSHFLGQRHGTSVTPRKLTPEMVFVYDRNNGRRESRAHLKKALEEVGVEYVCAECGQPPEWNGKPLVLHVDHIDGDCLNNVQENLRFLCPHCHTQTSTFGCKKR